LGLVAGKLDASGMGLVVSTSHRVGYNCLTFLSPIMLAKLGVEG
jgi:hypothetical protein